MAIKSKWPSVCIILLIMATTILSTLPPQNAVNAAPRANIFSDIAGEVFGAPAKTVGDLLTKVLGIESTIDLARDAIDEAIANAGEEVRETVRAVGEEARATLEKFREDIENTIVLLSEQYKDNLDVTIDSLDELTRRKLREIEDSIIKVNKLIQDDIVLLKESSIEVIEQAGDELVRVVDLASLQLSKNVNLLGQTLERTIIVAGITGDFLVDEFFNNLLSWSSIIMLGIGLLLLIFLLFSRTSPKRSAGAAITIFAALYMAGFGTLVFAADARAFVLNSTNLGVSERVEHSSDSSVVYVTPVSLIPGTVDEVRIQGSHLQPGGKTPIVTLGGKTVKILAIHDSEITVDVRGLDFAAIDIAAFVLELDWGDGQLISISVDITPTPSATPTPDLTATAESIAAAATQEAIVTMTAIAVDNPHVTFEASATEIDEGACATLLWEIRDVASVTLDGNTVEAQDQVEVCPTSTTNYTLRFTKLNGNSDSKSINIFVRSAPEVPEVSPPTFTPPRHPERPPCPQPPHCPLIP